MPQYQGVWSLQQQMQALTSGQWATDPLFDYTTLLLQGDAGANGAQNNVFYDTSPNQFAITRNGNTTQGTFSPFSATGWGNYFDGSSLLRATASSLSSASFTVEAWVYYTGSSASTSAIYDFANATAGYGMALSHTSAGNLSVQFYSNNTGTVIGTIASNFSGNYNTWAHIAVTYDGSTYRLFLNGLSIGTPVSSATQVVSLNSLTIGARSDASPTQAWNGYISNFRYVTGAALYTSNFTPTTSPLGIAGSGTTRLLTCQSNRFVDNSSSPYTLTVSGTPSVQAFSPFAPQFQYTASVTGGSGYFDGSDYLSIASAGAQPQGTENWCIEMWVYLTTISTSTDTPWFEISSSGGIQIFTTSSGTVLQLGIFGSGSITTYTLPSGVVNSWNHFVFTRSSNTFRIMHNGVLRANATNASSLSTGTLNIFSRGASNYSTGYCGLTRVTRAGIPTDYQTSSTTNGTSIYTVPTAPATTTSQGATLANTALLLNFTNAGILDGTMKNNLETVGGASVSTSVVKYGSGSMYFDGSGDALIDYDPSYLNSPGSGDWTFETWVYLNALPGAFTALYHLKNDTSTATTVFIVEVTSAGRLNVSTGTALIAEGTSGLITAGSWIHVAVTRAAGTIRTFINGVQDKSASNTTTYNGTYDFFGVWRYGGSDNYLNGYMDDLRITKGIARYTQNFIPPSVALPRQ